MELNGAILSALGEKIGYGFPYKGKVAYAPDYNGKDKVLCWFKGEWRPCPDISGNLVVALQFARLVKLQGFYLEIETNHIKQMVDGKFKVLKGDAPKVLAVLIKKKLRDDGRVID